MTGPDLIRLAHELVEDKAGGVHRLTNLMTAAVHVFLEHDRASWPPTLRAEPNDYETGVGMSDKAAGGICAGFAVRGAPTAFNPAPIRAERGERKPLPQSDCQGEHPRGGISHDARSAIDRMEWRNAQNDFGRRERKVPKFDGKRTNPEDLGDGA